MKNVIFIHAANCLYDRIGNLNQKNRCQDILNTMKKYIEESKILDHVSEINVELYGEPDVQLDLPKVNMTYNGPNIRQYEIPTLNKIKNYANSNSESKILYIHTKGASYSSMCPEYILVQDILNYLLHQNISRFQECLENLNHYDTCGAELIHHPVTHYSHNFWWTTAKHVNSLDYALNYPMVYDFPHQGEFWICRNPSGKYKTIFNLYDHFLNAGSFESGLYINRQTRYDTTVG